MKKIFFLSFFVLGFSSLVSQVLVIRELAMSCYPNEFFIGWILFLWLMGTAAGSFLEGQFFQRGAEIGNALWMFPVLTAAIFPIALVLIRAEKLILGTAAGAFPDLFPSLFFSMVALAPLCLIFGFQFPHIIRCWLARNPPLQNFTAMGQAYFFEIFGAVFGGMLYSFAFIFWNEFFIAAVVMIANLVTACILFCFLRKTGRFLRRVLIAGAVFVPLWLMFHSGSLQERTLQWRFPNEILVKSENTIHGNIAVTRLEKQYNFYQNGLFLGTEEEKLANEYLVHFSMLFHPNPQKVLLFGTGFNGAIREILKHNPAEVYDVELDPRLVAVAERYLSANLRDALHDKRVHVWLGDSRAFLNSQTGFFDLIIVNEPNPSTVLLNRQYTIEFFQRLREHLAPGGIVSMRLTFSANAVTPELESLAASMDKTLKRVFLDQILLPEDTLYMIASMTPLVRDPNILIRRMEKRGLKNDFVTPAYLKYRITNDRVSWVRNLLNQNRTANINQDLRPQGYYYDFLYWISSFHSGLARILSLLQKVPFTFLFWFLLLAIFLCRIFLHGRSLAVMAMATGGFSLMASEILLIYSFQVFYGNLYYRIAWIITAFMIGIGVGTWWGNRQNFREPYRPLGWIHATVATYFSGLTLLGWLLVQGSWLFASWGQWMFLANAIGIGGFIGIEFPLANRLFFSGAGISEVRTGMIYAADLFGSCLGALLTAAFLIPVWGVGPTLLLLIGSNAAMALLLVFRKNLGSKNF